MHVCVFVYARVCVYVCVCLCMYVCLCVCASVCVLQYNIVYIVASEIPGRTGQQCMHRWQKALMPGIKKGRWTTEEDEVRVTTELSQTLQLPHTATEASRSNIWSR